MSKIPIYFLPGMSSTSLIFEHIFFDESKYELVFLEWLPVEKKENLDQYTQRYLPLIKHENPVLIGVSFGGILAQEISKLISVKKTIIISSVRSNKEFPKLFHFARKTGLYKYLPTSMVNTIFGWIKKTASAKRKKRLELYDRYLPLRDKKYLDWAIREVLKWKQDYALDNVVHIHGTRDEIFPFKNIKSAITIEGGTHAMIITKYKWFNNNLETLI
ncbi:alpha/beta hydrolase [Myroides marinus]|uniref:alpha/beta hydrolase n=1 Tax=Myroides marinus TaxID=703342 RepID=UPI00257600AE|nr:alpha/beta hydrolase [Myroides marinus]MDM1346769.1 alpha/beta hydrolase [Myroides marinus]MDM1350446.1 alpha/beta hydrolase [Myroides marinus]MDM1357653.1 alpha/beta hydrolase [Myroides marinus]MDM1361512.1 alpha/beta hydrolase [Myroides marinus]MDM1365088.1 alpha/beta hydrolase [Myroides marinus]